MVVGFLMSLPNKTKLLILCQCLYRGASLVAQTVKNPPAMQKTWVPSLGWEAPLEKEMATHFSILAWEIPWTEEPDGLQSMGSQGQTRLSTCVSTALGERKGLLSPDWDPRDCSTCLSHFGTAVTLARWVAKLRLTHCDPPLSTGFPRQEYWSGLPFLSPGDLFNPGIKSASLALEDRLFTTEPPGKSFVTLRGPG